LNGCTRGGLSNSYLKYLLAEPFDKDGNCIPEEGKRLARPRQIVPADR